MWRVSIAGFLGALLASCAPADAHDCVCPPGDTAPRSAAHDELRLTRVTWKDLPGWADDQHGEAIPAFLASCAKLAELPDDAPIGHDGHGGKAKQWRRACERAAKLRPGDHGAARAFFEAEFTPYQAAGRNGPVGKLTGYFVQEIRASRKKGGKYQVPILARPPDLVMVDLSQFIGDAYGRRIWGRHDDQGKIVPYYTRAEIRKGALAPPYDGTMQGIRKWLADHPTRFDEIVDHNASYVFFKESKEPGAVGSQGVILTPRRSLAIDRAFIAHSTPIWVDTRAPSPNKPGTSPWRRLLVAQDTGGGILGAVRGDIYWGDDAVAADLGGRTGGPGRFWLLLPKGVTK